MAQSLDEMAKKVDLLIEEYYTGMGLPKNPKVAAERYLSASEAEMLAMTKDQRNVAATVLAQYSFFLQKTINKEIATLNWITTTIDKTIAPVMKQYNLPTAIERRVCAIRENEFAVKCESLRTQVQLRVDSMNYLSNKVDLISLRFHELGSNRES